jgi:hypothetical protein
LDCQIGEFADYRFGSTPFPEPLSVKASLLSSIHRVLLSFLSSIHPLYRVVAYSTMNSNDEEDETAIIVATEVVAILYMTVPEKEKRVALVFDQRLCWNRFTEMHGHVVVNSWSTRAFQSFTLRNWLTNSSQNTTFTNWRRVLVFLSLSVQWLTPASTKFLL